ncbi:MAG: type VI secretion system tip protein VgrG [Gemmatimonadetes bacterium]|nr:type VI secretion system tip protein VgrG [Gemmatimonadota bacterium]
MAVFSQSHRPIRVDSVLGEDVLLLNGFVGTEAISRPFGFRLDLLSTDPEIDPDAVLGTAMVVSIRQHGGSERKVHGLVSRFAQQGRHEGVSTYRAEIVPWLWFLSLSADCRIFQNKDALQIVQEVFSDLGWTDVTVRCTRSYREREFCVQYRETHLDFVSRLLEEEGIFYFFEHTETAHTLVLADSNSVLDPCPEHHEIPLRSGGMYADDHIATLERQDSVYTGAVALTDYDYLQPPRSLDAFLSGEGRGEVFEYRPRWYDAQDHGDRYARVLLERREARRKIVFGKGSCRHFLTGFTFELTGHHRDDLNREYLLTEVSYAVRGGSYSTWDSHTHDHDVSFVAIPSDVPYRPEPRTPKPRIFGSQTAEVVGKDGEEIWTDEHGRIKVQFHWDRYGEKDENSSCWVRVASRWAGKGWGEIHVPRIGQEVVVDFLEGNPDAPLVTGAVYNGDHPPPWGLPDDQTRSGVKSRSSKGGGGWNEISMDDRKGQEQVTIRAQKDMGVQVLNDQSTTVGNDQSTSVANDQTISVGNDRTISVGGNRSETVSGDTSLTVADGDRTQTVAAGKSDEYVKGDRGVKVDGSAALTVQNSVDVSVGTGDLTVNTGAGKVTVDSTGGVHVTTPADVTFNGTNVKANGTAGVLIKGAKVTVEGMAEVTLKVGPNFVKIDPTGVTIFGTIVKIN